MQTFERLALWREEQKLSQSDAGARVGVTGPAWNDWEKGKRSPQGGYRKALEILTGIPEGEWMSERELAAIAAATAATLPDDERPTLTPDPSTPPDATPDARAA